MMTGILAAALNAAAALTVTETAGVDAIMLAFDVAADGTSDRLAATGTLDLSGLSLALGDATALEETKIYTIATATEVTGTFANAALPNKWKVFPQGTRVVIGYANGTVVVFR